MSDKEFLMKYNWGRSELARLVCDDVSQLALEDERRAAIKIMESAVDLTVEEFKDPLRVSKNWEILKEYAQVSEKLEKQWRADLKALLIIKKMAQTHFKDPRGCWVTSSKAKGSNVIDINLDHDDAE
jgi:hypothetical protein